MCKRGVPIFMSVEETSLLFSFSLLKTVNHFGSWAWLVGYVKGHITCLAIFPCQLLNSISSFLDTRSAQRSTSQRLIFLHCLFCRIIANHKSSGFLEKKRKITGRGISAGGKHYLLVWNASKRINWTLLRLLLCSSRFILEMRLWIIFEISGACLLFAAGNALVCCAYKEENIKPASWFFFVLLNAKHFSKILKSELWECTSSNCQLLLSKLCVK